MQRILAPQKRSFFFSFFVTFLVSFLLLFRSPLWAKTVVVSDVDETIKLSRFSRYFNGQGSFPELIKIYRDLKGLCEERQEEIVFYYLTAAPAYYDLVDWLRRHDAPAGQIQQRSVRDLLWADTATYKLTHLKAFLKRQISEFEGGQYPENESLKIVMFGDNTKADPRVYGEILDSLSMTPHQSWAFIRRINPAVENLHMDNLHYFEKESELLMTDVFSRLLSRDLDRHR